MRSFLDSQTDVIESISLRTMLNFNRTYEQYWLAKIGSEYADSVYDNEGVLVQPKSVDDSVKSFIDSLPPAKQDGMKAHPAYIRAISQPTSEIKFKLAFGVFGLIAMEILALQVVFGSSLLVQQTLREIKLKANKVKVAMVLR
jgi:hypothetical protein